MRASGWRLSSVQELSLIRLQRSCFLSFVVDMWQCTWLPVCSKD